jgi:hypothetical protein
MMTRTLWVLCVGFAATILATNAYAGKKLYVGNLPFSPADQALRVEDDSTVPATPIQDIRIVLNSGKEGSYDAPLGAFATVSSLAIVNPGADGRGDAGSLRIGKGPGAFPASSVFDVSLAFLDPRTGQPVAQMQKGTVKFFNEAKGFGFVVSGGDPGGVPVDLFEVTGQIDAARTGLTFSGVHIFQPAGDGTFSVFPELSLTGTSLLDANAPLFDITITPVPEPSALAAAGVALAAWMALHRRRHPALALV